ncbi:hypothetical protein ACJX0J_012532, partial [Zea mays]
MIKSIILMQIYAKNIGNHDLETRSKRLVKLFLSFHYMRRKILFPSSILCEKNKISHIFIPTILMYSMFRVAGMVDLCFSCDGIIIKYRILMQIYVKNIGNHELVKLFLFFSILLVNYAKTLWVDIYAMNIR